VKQKTQQFNNNSIFYSTDKENTMQTNKKKFLHQPVYVGIYLPLAPANSNYRLETKKNII
jgi:hypothetical protein